jgi:hypothetical protein
MSLRLLKMAPLSLRCTVVNRSLLVELYHPDDFGRVFDLKNITKYKKN